MPEFEYTVIRRPRRKTASISVRADDTVVITVPARLPQKHIERLVVSKARWIRDRLHLNEEFRQRYRPKEYVSGEAFAYLGRNYRLKVLEGKTGPASLTQGRIHVRVPPGMNGEEKTQHIIRQLTAWYQRRAEKRLGEKVACYATQLGVTPTRAGIKSYRSHWGSCHRDGRVYFNWRIIMAPHAVVDYLVVHELCHLVHHNHSPAFWQLVASILPDYREAKIWLKTNGQALEV